METMWPKLLDLSREESKRILRRLELEAYSGIISAFRAHGDLTKDKKRLLSELQHLLSISTERHRAEVRRAVNDEKLTTIADGVAGPNISSEWLIEGRRLIPLMPRLVPQTAFTGLADNIANVQAGKHSSMLPPYATNTKEIATLGASSSAVTTPTAAGPLRTYPPHRPASPTSNIVVLPSGMSIRIEGGLNTDEDEEIRGKKPRRRSSSSMTSSIENVPMSMTPPASRPHQFLSGFTPPVTAPMKITFAKSPQKLAGLTASNQKVILVSGASTSTSGGATVVQKSSSASYASTTTTSAADQPKTSIILPPANQSMSLTSTTPTEAALANQISQYTSLGKVRPKLVHPRGKAPIQFGQTKSGMVLPLGSLGSQSPGQVHVRAGKPTIQVKHEGGMKIITHAAAVGGASGVKMAVGGSSKTSPVVARPASSPLVVVSNSSSIAVMTKSVTGVTTTPGITRKVLNVTTQGGKVIATSRPGGISSNVVTVNPKTLQITAVKSASGGAKPNVIVVQKAQSKPSQKISTTTLDKVPDLVSFLQKQESHKSDNPRLQLSTTPSGHLPSVVRVEKKVIQKPQLIDLAGKKFQIRTSDGTDVTKSSSILADLIHQVGNLPPDVSTSSSGQQLSETEKAAAALNEWVEYDLPTDDVTITQPMSGESSADAQQAAMQEANMAAIKSLLKLQRGPVQTQQTQQKQLPTRVNLKQLSSQIEEGQFFNIDQSTGVISQQTTQSRVPVVPRQRRVVVTSADAIQQLLQSSSRSATATIASLTGAGPGAALEQELLGELDPQTGLFYPTSTTGQKGQPILLATDKSGKGAPLDIFSSALAEAQIDLDPYQFMEEQDPEAEVAVEDVEQASKALAEAGSTGPQFAVLPPQVRQVVECEDQSVSEECVTQSQLVSTGSEGESTFITLQQISEGRPTEVMAMVSRASHDPTDPLSVAPNVSVAVQPSGLDASLMNLEDFTSQRLDDPGSSGTYTDGDGNVELGKRKRKAPASLEDSPPMTAPLSSWIRGAMNLIQRVSRYRGAQREKGEINAAAWFLRPVNPAEAPDYYRVIKTPMDFGTIRRKLETGMYSNLDEFHQDMCLIRQNCHMYNPPNHEVRRDCDEVFTFYISEYERLVDRLKAGTNSPPVKKTKVLTPPSSV